MRKLLPLLLVALLTTACGSTHLFEFIDLKHPDTEYMAEHAAELRTRFPTTFIQTSPEGKITEIPLRAGTTLRVLAGIARIPHYDTELSGRKARPGSYSPDTYYIVERTDGTRGIARLPEMAVGQQVTRVGADSLLTVTDIRPEGKKSDRNPHPYRFSCNDGQSHAFTDLAWEPMRMPMYGWLTKDPRSDVSACIKGEIVPNYNKFHDAGTLDGFIPGASFAEVERRFGPAMQITGTGAHRTALYPHISRRGDSPGHMLAVEVKDSTAVGYRLLAEQPEMRGLTKFVISLYGNSATGNVIRHYDYWLFPRFGFFDTLRMGTVVGRIVDILLCIVLGFVFFGFLLVAVTYPLMYIRKLSNGQVLALRTLLFLLLSAAVIYLLGLYMESLSFLIVLILIYSGRQSIRYELESERCPHCHTTGRLCFDGETDRKTSRSKSEVRTEKKVTHKTKSSSSWTDHEGTHHVSEKITEHWVPVRKQTVTTTRTWRNEYHCPDCGETIYYRREETDSHDETVG